MNEILHLKGASVLKLRGCTLMYLAGEAPGPKRLKFPVSTPGGGGTVREQFENSSRVGHGKEGGQRVRVQFEFTPARCPFFWEGGPSVHFEFAFGCGGHSLQNTTRGQFESKSRVGHEKEGGGQRVRVQFEFTLARCPFFVGGGGFSSFRVRARVGGEQFVNS